MATLGRPWRQCFTWWPFSTLLYSLFFYVRRTLEQFKDNKTISLLIIIFIIFYYYNHYRYLSQNASHEPPSFLLKLQFFLFRMLLAIIFRKSHVNWRYPIRERIFVLINYSSVSLSEMFVLMKLPIIITGAYTAMDNWKSLGFLLYLQGKHDLAWLAAK